MTYVEHHLYPVIDKITYVVAHLCNLGKPLINEKKKVEAKPKVNDILEDFGDLSVRVHDEAKNDVTNEFNDVIPDINDLDMDLELQELLNMDPGRG